MTLNKWIFLLAAVMAITAPEVSYAQFGALGGAAKNKAVEVLTNKVMEELEKKFAEMVAKEPISDAAKANIVAKLSEMSRPIVKQYIDGAVSGKLPNPAELTQSVLNDILPRVPDLVAAAGTEGGGGTTSVPASAIQPAARPQIPAPDSGDGVVIYNRHCYVRLDRSMTWTEAKAYSESLGGHLATITSREEQEAVYLLIKDGKKNFYWLGGYREGKNWQHVTGENFTYNNWISGRPDNANNREDKLIMVRISPSWGGNPGQWDDFNNNGEANNMGYICEFDNAVQPAAQQLAKTQSAAPAIKETGDNWGAFSLELTDNFKWADNYQIIFTDKRLFNGHRIVPGETYTLKITYTASRDLENTLGIMLVDTTPAAKSWKLLSAIGGKGTWIAASKAGKEVSATITLKTKARATDSSEAANALVFNTRGKGKVGVAGSGKQGPVTLNFTEFIFTKVE